MKHEKPDAGQTEKNPLDFKAAVTRNVAITENIRLMTVQPQRTGILPVPGQFFMMKAWNSHDPFLFRPLAAAGNHADGSIDILFRIVGKGTSLLSECDAGQTVLMRGPCGNGFPKPKGARLLLAAGAMGTAPLLFARSFFGPSLDTRLLLGVSGEKEWEPFCDAILRKYPDTELFSENGRIGEKGTVLDALEKEAASGDEIWACGPEGMLRALKCLDAGRNLSMWVSLERRMACGYGGCLGCSIQTCNGPRRVCVDGPVFPWKEIVWDETS